MQKGGSKWKLSQIKTQQHRSPSFAQRLHPMMYRPSQPKILEMASAARARGAAALAGAPSPPVRPPFLCLIKGVEIHLIG